MEGVGIFWFIASGDAVLVLQGEEVAAASEAAQEGSATAAEIRVNRDSKKNVAQIETEILQQYTMLTGYSRKTRDARIYCRGRAGGGAAEYRSNMDRGWQIVSGYGNGTKHWYDLHRGESALAVLYLCDHEKAF